MERIEYAPYHSMKTLLAQMRLKGFRRRGTQLDQIGACVCCGEMIYRNGLPLDSLKCSAQMRLMALLTEARRQDAEAESHYVDR